MTARKPGPKAAPKAPKKAPSPARKPAKKAESGRAPAVKPARSTRSTPTPAELDPIVAADELRDLRAELRKRLRDPETPGSAIAALSRELRAVVAELAALEPEEVSRVDDLAARRVARRTGAADTAPASRRSQPRRRGGSSRTS